MLDKHSLVYNNYISFAFKKRFKNPKFLYFYIFKLIRYTFYDIPVNMYTQIIPILFTTINDNDNDYIILKNIYVWYKNILKKYIISFPMTNNEYTHLKVRKMAKFIGNINLHQIKNTLLFDIGCGDCKLTKLFADYVNMVPVGIDIKTNINWSSLGSSACDQVKYILYDGNNLQKIYKKHFKNKDVGLIMYNHSLHHFGNFENIYNSLNDAYNLLTNKGILFIREHDNDDNNNNNNNIEFNLQHITLALRHTIDQNPNWTYKQYWEYYKKFINTYSSHFMSKEFIINICIKIGFKLIDIKNNNIYNNNYTDISKTYLISFIKNYN
jgi:SAM-dependent methyltransferase